jgi:hypothetical protein
MFGAKSASSWLRSCAAATELQPDRYTAHSVLSEIAPPSFQDRTPVALSYWSAGRRGALPRERFSPLTRNGHQSRLSLLDLPSDGEARAFSRGKTALDNDQRLEMGVNGMRSFGHWVKYDADAAQRSVLEVHDFLATELAK